MASITQPSSPRLAAQAPLRFVTATSIFDGHDAAINIIRRLLQAQGAEVVHLGHNRGVEDIVRAALQEDADGIAVSSYQGGHLEFFRYLLDSLKAAGAGEMRVFAGGGGTITDEEAKTLEAHGVEKIYLPEDGQRLGLEGMAKDIIARARALKSAYSAPRRFGREDIRAVGRTLSLIETGPSPYSPSASPVSGLGTWAVSTVGAAASVVVGLAAAALGDTEAVAMAPASGCVLDPVAGVKSSLPASPSDSSSGLEHAVNVVNDAMTIPARDSGRGLAGGPVGSEHHDGGPLTTSARVARVVLSV